MKDANKVAKKISLITNLVFFFLFIILCYKLKLKWSVILIIIGISVVFEKLAYVFVLKILNKKLED